MVDVDVSLETKRDWVSRVLGVPLGGEPGLDPAEVRGRLNEVGLRLRDLGATPLAAELKPQFAEAVQALKASDLEQVMLILDEIEPLMAGALSGARATEAARVIGSAEAWRDAVALITSSLDGFKTSVISLLVSQEHEQEEIDDVGEQLNAEIADITEKLGEGLSDQVDAVINGDPSRRAAGVEKIMASIQTVEDQIVNHEGVDLMEDNGVIPIAIRQPAKAALDELRAALNEAAAQASKVAA
jgi:hypothetical protein